MSRHVVEERSGIKPKIDWSQATPIPTTWVGIVAGEALYNLRAGLDYLVHSLAWLDSGQLQLHTQFPIARTASSFQTQRRERLKGLSDPHISVLEEYQPYHGCEWTALLQELSNPDKHRNLPPSSRSFPGTSPSIEPPSTLILKIPNESSFLRMTLRWISCSGMGNPS